MSAFLAEQGREKEKVDIPLTIQRSIHEYKTIEWEGLLLYPIRVSEYSEFLSARPAISFAQQTLPVRFLSMPLLSAYFALDCESLAEGGQPVGYFSRALLFLALALRLEEGRKIEERLSAFRTVIDPKHPGRLTSIQFPLPGTGWCEITPTMFHRMRPVLAAQNGIDLVSPDANPELLEAEQELAQMKAPNLDAKVENMIFSVAAFSHCDESEIYEWPILKLHNRANSYKRAMDYMIYGIGETQGTKWKGGNPHPSPWFEKIRNESDALVPMDQFVGGNGLKAMNSPGVIPEQFLEQTKE